MDERESYEGYIFHIRQIEGGNLGFGWLVHGKKPKMLHKCLSKEEGLLYARKYIRSHIRLVKQVRELAANFKG